MGKTSLKKASVIQVDTTAVPFSQRSTNLHELLTVSVVFDVYNIVLPV